MINCDDYFRLSHENELNYDIEEMLTRVRHIIYLFPIFNNSEMPFIHLDKALNILYKI